MVLVTEPAKQDVPTKAILEGIHNSIQASLQAEQQLGQMAQSLADNQNGNHTSPILVPGAQPRPATATKLEALFGNLYQALRLSLQLQRLSALALGTLLEDFALHRQEDQDSGKGPNPQETVELHTLRNGS